MAGGKSVRDMLEHALGELLEAGRREEALVEASIAAVECALRLVTVSEGAQRGNPNLVEPTREALASARASVVATSCALWTMDDERRERTHER
ncbi:hypothetical protein AB0A63_10140 [Lentzea sp. NPDC042327]|uniref:hypothetical protein n=1 Tax=Lentzea sp. NPDC042327 TaxID=3154801 RepID=UPI0033D12D8C